MESILKAYGKYIESIWKVHMFKVYGKFMESKNSPAVDEQKAGDKLLHGNPGLLVVLFHVLADDVTDRGALVVVEVEAARARVASRLLHLLLAQGGLVLGVVRQVVKEPLLHLSQLANCTVVENHRFTAHCACVIGTNVFHHIQLSLRAEATNLAGVACSCVEEIHMNLGKTLFLGGEVAISTKQIWL